MREEREYIHKMKAKLIESVDKNEFDQYLMGENDYVVSSREIPVPKLGTGNLWTAVMLL